ncbi:PAS domain S-box protein [Acidobacteriota bacterium]
MSIRTKLILILLGFTIIPIVFVVILSYSHATKALENTRIAALESIADLKAAKIEAFFDERRGDITAARGYPSVKKNLPVIASLQHDRENPAYIQAYADVDVALGALQRIYHYSDVLLLDTEGIVVYSSKEEHSFPHLGNRLAAPGLAPLNQASQGTALSDVYRTDTGSYPYTMLAVTSVHDNEDDFIGTLALQVDMAPVYELIQDTTGLGETGETLVARTVGDGALFLNPLRHDPEAALKRKAVFGEKQAIPIQEALQGRSGVGVSVDYRPEKVLAAWRYIPSLDWGMVAKIDTKEAFASVSRLRQLYLLLVVIIVVIGSSLAYQVTKSVSNPVIELERKEAQVSALLTASRAVLEYREFEDAAKAIFDSCKEIIGAQGGYIAVLTEDGKENQVVYLDSGDFSCTVDQSLPMPIRGLREEAYRTGQPVFHNDFPNSVGQQFMPEGHVSLNSVLFSPLKIEGVTVGLLGLGNKPGGFKEKDALLASAFSEFVAIALRNSRMLELLEQSEERFRSVVQTANDAIVTCNREGKIVFWNRTAEILFGYSSGETTDKPLTTIMPERFHDKHVEGFKRLHTSEHPAFNSDPVEVIGLTKEGREFPIELSRASWKAKGEVFFTAVIRDITKRKEDEARQALVQEREKQHILSMRSDRLRSLGEMAAGIAHELNQPLVGVRGVAEHMLLSIDRGWELDRDTIKERAKTIQEQADRMVHIIEHVRMFAREAGKPVRRPMQVNKAIRSATEMIETQFISRGIQLRCDLEDNLPFVLANPYSVEEVIINLLINARDALEETRRIEGGARDLSVDVISFVENSDSKPCVKIQVKDNGAGIPEDVIEKVFDPFFTTKGPDKGTGLGLAISKSIVEGFGGTIDIQAKPGAGTTLTVSFPVD